jgi:hypothetical protein
VAPPPRPATVAVAEPPICRAQSGGQQAAAQCGGQLRPAQHGCHCGGYRYRVIRAARKLQGVLHQHGDRGSQQGRLGRSGDDERCSSMAAAKGAVDAHVGGATQPDKGRQHDQGQRQDAAYRAAQWRHEPQDQGFAPADELEGHQ